MGNVNESNTLMFLPHPEGRQVLLVSNDNRVQMFEIVVPHAVFAGVIREYIDLYSGEATFEQANEVMLNVAQPVEVEPLELRGMMINCMFQMFYSGLKNGNPT